MTEGNLAENSWMFIWLNILLPSFPSSCQSLSFVWHKMAANDACLIVMMMLWWRRLATRRKAKIKPIDWKRNVRKASNIFFNSMTEQNGLEMKNIERCESSTSMLSNAPSRALANCKGPHEDIRKWPRQLSGRVTGKSKIDWVGRSWVLKFGDSKVFHPWNIR